MDYQKIKGKGYSLNLIRKKGSKRSTINIVFAKKIKYEDITKRYFLNQYLITITKNYPSERLLFLKKEDLYSVSLNSFIERIGNLSFFGIKASFLNEEFTEKGMTDQTIKLLKEVIYNCNFTEEQFQIIKKRIIEDIKAEEESKQYKATMSLREAMDKNAPFAFRDKYLKQLNQLKLEDIEEYYKLMIKESNIGIYVIGDFSFPLISNKIIKNFSFKTKTILLKNNDFTHKKFRLLPKRAKENDDINQSILRIGFKIKETSKFEQKYVLPIYCEILGGSSNSKLFNEVREKHSLAYYANSRYLVHDNVLFITSGISKENYKLTKNIILNIIGDLRKGKFTDEDIESAKISIINSMERNRNQPFHLLLQQIEKQYFQAGDINQEIKQLKKVNKSQIIMASKKIKLDTIYFLCGGESNETDK